MDDSLATLKKCVRCGKIKPRSEYFRDKTRPSGFRYYCKLCHYKWRADYLKKNRDHINSKMRICSKRYREKLKTTEHGRGINRARAFRNYHKNIDKARARVLLRTYVFEGKILKPESCFDCGKSNCRISGHHHMGYDDKNKLNVIWLCDQCHVKRHRSKAKE
jgi:hypothetical protein